jgi:hypothetical protein
MKNTKRALKAVALAAMLTAVWGLSTGCHMGSGATMVPGAQAPALIGNR